MLILALIVVVIVLILWAGHRKLAAGVNSDVATGVLLIALGVGVAFWLAQALGS